MRLSVLFFSLLLFTQCGQEPYGMKDISEYEIVKEGLEHGEQVEVIYSSGSPDDNFETNYYLQMIVVSQASFDTFNLLTTINSNVTEKDRMRYFVGADSPVNKLFENLDQFENGMKIQDLEEKKIDQVIVNNETKSEIENTYPTIIGTLANEIRPMDN
jgi:hypothetical protein